MIFQKLRKFFFKEDGNVGIIFGLTVVPMITGMGMAVDMGKAHLVKKRLGFALDAAVLATASSMNTSHDLQDQFDTFIRVNFTDDSLGHITNTTMTVTDNRIFASATAEVDTSFMHFVGTDEMEVYAENEVVRETKGVEVALVLDNTGSMRSHNNIGALRDASQLFLDELFGDDTYNEDFKVALVPYSAIVNPGAEALNGSIVEDVDNQNYDPVDPYAWRGCVTERPYPYDAMDTSVADGGYWQPSYWAPAADNDWRPPNRRGRRGRINDNVDDCNGMTGPNLGCPRPIVPLTSSATDLRGAVDDLRAYCRGGTTGNLGMAWGWRVLSPQPPFTEGAAYNDTDWEKVVVMMTDGNNLIWRYNVSGNHFDSDYTGYERLDDMNLGTTSRNAAKTVINGRLEESCEAMKQEGITIYTITFTSGIDSNTRDIYRRCASDESNYYNAPSQEDLRRTFSQIGAELSNLRLSH